MDSDTLTDHIRKINSQRWYNLNTEAVYKLLETVPQKGLSWKEAEKRLEAFGPNEIETQEGPTTWRILLHQFEDPLIYILLAAALVTFVLQDYIDSAVIMAVVLLNAIIGFVQESRAQTAIQSLSKMAAPKAHVIRDGRETEIPGSKLVPGDILLLTSGNRVAADVRIIQSRLLEVNESALTGESMVIHKQVEPLEAEHLVPADQINMAFAGTIVSQGRARCIVVRTGGSTELGKIASSVQQIGITQMPLQGKLDRIGHNIGYIILALSVIIAITGLIRQMNPVDVFITVVALAVSAIPEGLPVVMTVTLAIGVRRMAGRQAIVRFLPAVETLGSTTVIGSDKTGTLTKNQMTVQKIWTGQHTYITTGTGYQLEGQLMENGSPVSPAKGSALYQTLLAGTLANEANVNALAADDPQGDPTEIALHISAYKGGLSLSGIRMEMEELDILPFEPERQFMATLNRNGTNSRIFLKGAPEAILDKCDKQLHDGKPVALNRSQVEKAFRQLAAEGLRILAMAYKPWEGENLQKPDVLSDGFILAGLQGMEDPIRPEALQAVRTARQAGIRVIMITGDHIDTATTIGRQLELNTDHHGALEGRALDGMTDAELDTHLKATNIFARVTPEHKFRIVDRLKHFGHIVAVTGDGVNDAPALRAAHLGIAMGKSGTDVAREASDMIISDDNFSTIAAAIEEGRIVFSNIRKVTFFLLSTAVGEVIVILAALVFGWPLPFIAVQILWINLVTNGLQDVALAFEPGEPGILKRKPRPPREGILTVMLIQRLGGVGLVLATGTLGMFWWTFNQTGDVTTARTVAMTQMVVFQFFHVLNCRSLDRSLLEINFFSNKFLFLSMLGALLAHIAVLEVAFLQTLLRTVSLNLMQWMMIAGVGTLVILGGEIDKTINRLRSTHIG